MKRQRKTASNVFLCGPSFDGLFCVFHSNYNTKLQTDIIFFPPFFFLVVSSVFEWHHLFYTSTNFQPFIPTFAKRIGKIQTRDAVHALPPDHGALPASNVFLIQQCYLLSLTTYLLSYMFSSHFWHKHNNFFLTCKGRKSKISIRLFRFSVTKESKLT